jgi:hypothetical protein
MADELTYYCTLIRPNKMPIDLIVPRSIAEIDRLRKRGYTVHTIPVRPVPARNEHHPNVYSRALMALSELYQHAETTGASGLQQRAGDAISALLRNSSPDESR